MVTDPGALAEVAQAAVAAGDWDAARSAFEELVAQEPAAETLAGLGDVLWWLGRTADAVGYQQQAYAAFRRRDDPAGSVMAAVALYLIYRVSLGNVAAAHGWLARAVRLADECGLPALTGWALLIRAHDGADPEAAGRLAGQAREIGGRCADGDLELCALSQLGASRVEQGHGEEGTRLLDEAMAAALAGEATRPHTVVFTSCNLISACAQTAEIEHALQWIRAAKGFERRFGNPHLYTTCRSYLGTILFASGDWAGAERELLAALEIGVVAEPAVCAEAAARLAELRVAQGRLEEAEQLLEGFAQFDTSTAVLAQLASARGDLVEARRLAVHGVHDLAGHALARRGSYRPGLGRPLEEGALWDLLAQASHGSEAEAVVQHLTDLASRTGCAQLQARALRAEGRRRHDPALLERALSIFARLGLPLEAGRTRLVLAGSLTGEDAVAEARAARECFDELGAARDADAASARLRDLGVRATRGGSRDRGARGPRTGVDALRQLTEREREVLDLLGEGLSNRELAARLFLSRKTVEHHVRNVLSKLGLRNRAQAAAWVVRHRAQTRSGS